MENLRAFEESAESELAGSDEPAMDRPPEIGVDERRMHVRAYNYWVSLLDGRAYPSIEDVEPHSLDDFGPNSVLLDFTSGADNPAIAFIGRSLREECGLGSEIRTIADVPSRSLLSRLTDHYLQIIANCAPIGFEAEFVNTRGHNTMYRGILMPLSSDGDTIDFIYGVINWKEVADPVTTAGIAQEVGRTPTPTAVETSPVWADGPHAEPLGDLFSAPSYDGRASFDGDFEPHADNDGVGGSEEGEDGEGQHLLGLDLDPDAGLADRLCVAREAAQAVRSADARSRNALYRALGQAYDFALASEQAPEDYAELLEDSGLKAQRRAPMTPVVKLVFGIDYDKTRLTEFAAALAWARREDLGRGELVQFLERYPGGLKGVVAAERKARRPQPRPDRSAERLAALRTAAPLALVEVEAPDGEFVLLVGRREADGRIAVVGSAAADAPLIERTLRNQDR